MAYTQAQIDALQAAIAEGSLEVAYGDKRVKYRSLDEMLRILGLMKSEVNASPAGTGGVVYPSFSKGLDCL